MSARQQVVVIATRDAFGGNRQQHVRFTVDGRLYLASIYGDRVAMLHRVTQEYGGRAVGATHDKFTSVSRNNPKHGQLVALLANALGEPLDQPDEHVRVYQLQQMVDRAWRDAMGAV